MVTVSQIADELTLLSVTTSKIKVVTGGNRYNYNQSAQVAESQQSQRFQHCHCPRNKVLPPRSINSTTKPLLLFQATKNRLISVVQRGFTVILSLYRAISDWADSGVNMWVSGLRILGRVARFRKMIGCR